MLVTEHLTAKLLKRPNTGFAPPMQKRDLPEPEQPATIEEDLDNWTLTTESTRRVYGIDHNAEHLDYIYLQTLSRDMLCFSKIRKSLL